MVQPVSTGEWGVITDISFQRDAQDIKVARGNHYSDIVRSSLFRQSIFLVSSFFPCLFFPSFLYFPHSLLLFRSIFFSLALLSRCLFECIAPSQASGEGQRKTRLLIRIPRSRCRHLVANPFRSRRISTRTRPQNRDEGCVPIAWIST